MNSSLSISKAWDETRSRLAADGRLLFTVALAMVALPAAVIQYAFPQSGISRTPQSAAEIVLMLAVWLIGMIGQLALIRLAIGPAVSVGEAIVHGARRAPPFIGAVLLLLLAMFLLAIPFVAALAALGVSFEQGTTPPGSAWLVLLLFIALLLYLGIRMLMTSPVASAEQAGPIGIIRRSWALTAGNSLRLLGFMLLFIVAVIVSVVAVSIMATLLVVAVAGPVEPFTVSALIVALVESIVSAIVTAIFIVMIARIYVQLSGGGPVEPSVPKSAT